MIDQATRRRSRVRAARCGLFLWLVAGCGSEERDVRTLPDGSTLPDTDASVPPEADGGIDAALPQGIDAGTDAAAPESSDAAAPESRDGGVDAAAPESSDGGIDAAAPGSSDGGADAAVSPGALGSACSFDVVGLCQSGLSCAFVMNHPVERAACPHIATIAGAGLGCCLPTGGPGQHCGATPGSPECEAGLTCFLPSTEAARVGTCKGLSNCCVPSGDLNQPCGPSDDCNGGLVCTDAVSEAERTACGDSPSCCLATGRTE